MTDKHVEKFNSLLLMFLGDLAEAVPHVEAVSAARDCFGTLLALDPADNTALDKFVEAVDGIGSAVSAGNVDGVQNLIASSGLIDKERAMEVYRSLSSDDRKACWKYASKLCACAKKARPSLSPACAAAPLKELAMVAADKADAGLMPSALSASARRLAAVLADWEGPEAEARAAAAARIREMADSPDDMLNAVQIECGEGLKTLLITPEEYFEEVGLPFLKGGVSAASAVLAAAPDRDAIVAACVHLATVALALTCIPENAVHGIERIAASFAQKARDGAIDLEAIAADPMSAMDAIAQAGMADEIMGLVGEIMLASDNK